MKRQWMLGATVLVAVGCTGGEFRSVAAGSHAPDAGEGGGAAGAHSGGAAGTGDGAGGGGVGGAGNGGTSGGRGGSAAGAGGKKGTGGSGGSVLDSGGTSGVTGSADASAGGASVADAGPAPCSPLPSDATDVYVDKRYSGGTPTGTKRCPYTTILAGTAAVGTLSGTRIVHVAGDTPPVVYQEAGAVPVNTNVSLRGDGPAKTTIVASGPCGTRTCAVMVNGGGTVEGFTVMPSSGEGIVTALTAPAPIVRNVTVTGAAASGIVAFGAIELGPSIVLTKNAAQGLASTGAGLVHIVGAGVSNAFDNNGANGINIEGATLTFDGGSTSGNGLNGIRFGAAGSVTTTHTVTGLVATKNRNTGISAFSGQNLRLRSSSLLTNGSSGLLYVYVAGYSLDLGIATDVGGNSFGVATVAARNTRAGIYLCNSRGLGTQPAEGDAFSACPPTLTALTACDVLPPSYTDIAYVAAVAGSPVIAASCIAGP